MAATPPRVMSRRNWAEPVTGAVVVALGAVWIWLARDYGLIGEGGRLDAGTLPALAGAVLLVCGGIVVWSSLHGRVGATGADGPHLTSDDDSDGAGAGGGEGAGSKPRTAFLMLVASLALVTVVGFSLSLALYTLLVLLLVERRSAASSAGAAVAMWVFSYLCFEVLLGVPLPGPAFLDV